MREDVQAALAKVDKAWSPEHINWCAASSTLTLTTLKPLVPPPLYPPPHPTPPLCVSSVHVCSWFGGVGLPLPPLLLLYPSRLNPIMDSTQALIIVFMAYRGGMGPVPFAALLVVLFGVHPHAVVGAVALLQLWRARAKPRSKAGPGTHAGRSAARRGAVPHWPPPLALAAAAASQGGAKGAAAAAAVLEGAGDAYHSRDALLADLAPADAQTKARGPPSDGTAQAQRRRTTTTTTHKRARRRSS